MNDINTTLYFLLYFLFTAGVVYGQQDWAANSWRKTNDGDHGYRIRHALFYSKALEKVIAFGGDHKKQAIVMGFDPGTKKWTAISDKKPPIEKTDGKWFRRNASCMNREGTKIYAFGDGKLVALNLKKNAWQTYQSDSALNELFAWHMVFDDVNREVLFLGNGKKQKKMGWMGAVAFDLETQEWRKMSFGGEQQRSRHKQRLQVLDAVRYLVGSIRHSWYRDPDGSGTRKERTAILNKSDKIKEMSGFEYDISERLNEVDKLVREKRLLDALKKAKKLKRELIAIAESKSPVPPARRYARSVCDTANKSLVLFGGDHENYMTNDTWILDLTEHSWHRSRPEYAPEPRANHGITYLPGAKQVAIWDGLQYSNSTDYRANPAKPLPEAERLWFYDVKKERWRAAGAWLTSGANKKKFAFPTRFGYRNQGMFGYGHKPVPAPLTAGPRDQLITSGKGSKQAKIGDENLTLNATWMLNTDTDKTVEPEHKNEPNQHKRRKGKHRSSYLEKQQDAPTAGLDELKPYIWTKLNEPARSPFSGRRQTPWGTQAWNPDADEILLWGGGHTQSSTSVVTHWSPESNQYAHGYDLDEPYSVNGGGPGRFSVMGRPWVGTHAYSTYGYVTRLDRMVVIKKKLTFFYDPVRMDWVGRVKNPFKGHPYRAQLIPTSRGAVAWAGDSGYQGRSGRGLWLLEDTGTGWQKLLQSGNVPTAKVDTSGSVYDSKRDRVLLFPNHKKTSGYVWSYSFKNDELEKLKPDNFKIGKKANDHWGTYIAHLDWVLWSARTTKNGKPYHVVYDCKHNRWMLFHGGSLTDQVFENNTPLSYDRERRIVFASNKHGRIYAIKIEPESADVLVDF